MKNIRKKSSIFVHYNRIFLLIYMVNKKNPFASQPKQSDKNKQSGKRVGKSKPDKANNQLNRRVK